MPVSIFYSQHDCYIDAVTVTRNGDGYFQVGVIRAGGVKTFQFNELQKYDLNAPDSGPALPAALTITSAELWGNVTSLYAIASSYDLNRLDDPHAAYDDATATWLLWKAANNWNTPGGDTATPPPTVSYPNPTTLGDQRIVAGLGPLALDAIASRAGLLNVLHQQNPLVAAPDSSSYVLKPGNPAVSDSCRLIVTWHDPSIDAPPIDHPTAATMQGVPPSRGATPTRAGAPSSPARPQRPRTRRP